MHLHTETTAIETNEIFVNGITKYYAAVLEAKKSSAADAKSFVLNVEYKSESFRSLGFEVELITADELVVASLSDFVKLVLSYSRSYEIIKKLESFILDSFDKTGSEVIGLSGYFFDRVSAEQLIQLLLENRPELQCIRLEQECRVQESTYSFGPFKFSRKVIR